MKSFILPHILPLCQSLLLPSGFPTPSWNGIERKLKQCAGCRQLLLEISNRIRKPLILECVFARTGFGIFAPCRAVYHAKCIRVNGFNTRRKQNAGLCFPTNGVWPNFICEVCTVRQFIGREITTPGDVLLLTLERIRLIDMAWAWSKNTLSQYGSELRKIQSFERRFGVCILNNPSLKQPPSSVSIPLMWCMELQSTQMGRHPSRDMALANVSHNTIRKIRSAASQFYQYQASIACPTSSFINKDGKLLFQRCRPTDNVAMKLFAAGQSRRLGTDSNPSKPLLEHHVLAFDKDLDQQYHSPFSSELKRSISLAGFANISFWLSWVRSSELFHLQFRDIDVCRPEEYLTRDLPPYVGMIGYRLLPETKTSPTRQADVIVADRTFSGLQPLRWWARVVLSTGNFSADDLIFTNEIGTVWTSIYFRQTFLYPFLEKLRLKGDPSLQNGSLPALFWSLHCYRRGSRTQVDRAALVRDFGPGINNFVKSMVYEHARWERKRSSEEVDVMYREWTFHERVLLTLLFL